MVAPTPLTDKCMFYINKGKCKDDSNCENCVINVNSKTNIDKRNKLIKDIIGGD